MHDIAYIDASPLMARMMTLAWPDHAARMKVFVGDMDPDLIPAWVDGAATVVNGHTMMDAAMLDRMPGLRRIVFLGSGPRSYIDVDAAEARGITVDRIAGYGDRAVAEHALALILSASRDVARMDRDLRAGTWDPREGRELLSRRIGLIGFGGIARSLAEMAQALGMDVAIWNRSRIPAPWAGSAVDLDTLLQTSDVVSLHLALNPQTEGFLSADRIAMMRPDALLVNTARAGLVDTPALVAALEAGRIGHAALDVFDTEPLPPMDRLLSCPRLTLTAHAGFKTPEATERLARMAVALLRD